MLSPSHPIQGRMLRAGLTALSLAALSGGAQAADVEIGVLTCKVSGGVGFVFARRRTSTAPLRG